MKVVLFTLNASYVHKSLALKCLREPLEKSGFAVICCEFTVKEKRLKVLDSLFSEKADIYGFSCYIWNITEMLGIAEKLKKLLPESMIIFGGPEVSFESGSFLEKHPYIDHMVSGEGEESFTELCQRLASGEAVSEKIVAGKNFDGFCDAAFPYRRDDTLTSSIVYYESSRGCPYSCSYCLSAAEKGIRYKSVDTVLSELIQLQELSPDIKIVKFVDRTFNSDMKRAKAILTELISDKYKLNYHFEICAELIDDEMLELFSRFPKGKIQLEAGVQSTNGKTLSAINRCGDVKKCIENISRVRSLGNIHVHADLIAGLPYEDLYSFKNSFDELYGKCDMLQLGFLKLLKGSPLYEDAGKYEIVCSDTPPYEVLKTDCLSFDDICKLHGVSDILDRVGNSGHFRYTLEGVMRYVTSPFDFFMSLSQRTAGLDSMSQLKLIETVFEYCTSLGLLSKSELAGRMRLDYYIHESGTCPTFLSGADERSVTPVMKSIAIKKAGTNIFVPAAELHNFGYERDKYFLIDRKIHTCYEFTDKELVSM